MVEQRHDLVDCSTMFIERCPQSREINLSFSEGSALFRESALEVGNWLPQGVFPVARESKSVRRDADNQNNSSHNEGGEYWVWHFYCLFPCEHVVPV